MGVKWYGTQYEKMARKAVFKGLQSAGLLLHKISRKKASIAAPRAKKLTVGLVEENGKVSKKAKTTTVIKSASRPDESPFRRTGVGQKNIIYGHDSSLEQVRVGYGRLARYMIFHELGIHYPHAGFQQRPTIIPAMEDNWSILMQVVATRSQKEAAKLKQQQRKR